MQEQLHLQPVYHSSSTFQGQNSRKELVRNKIVVKVAMRNKMANESVSHLTLISTTLPALGKHSQVKTTWRTESFPETVGIPTIHTCKELCKTAKHSVTAQFIIRMQQIPIREHVPCLEKLSDLWGLKGKLPLEHGLKRQRTWISLEKLKQRVWVSGEKGLY